MWNQCQKDKNILSVILLLVSIKINFNCHLTLRYKSVKFCLFSVTEHQLLQIQLIARGHSIAGTHLYTSILLAERGKIWQAVQLFLLRTLSVHCCICLNLSASHFRWNSEIWYRPIIIWINSISWNYPNAQLLFKCYALLGLNAVCNYFTILPKGPKVVQLKYTSPNFWDQPII